MYVIKILNFWIEMFYILAFKGCHFRICIFGVSTMDGWCIIFKMSQEPSDFFHPGFPLRLFWASPVFFHTGVLPTAFRLTADGLRNVPGGISQTHLKPSSNRQQSIVLQTTQKCFIKGTLWSVICAPMF